MGCAVHITGVHKHYGKVHALKGIDLDIAEGEFFGLLGPNGAGKSTLINIMAGLSRASSGTVEVFGHNVVTAYRQSRALLGIVPQEIVFDPFFTVREILRIQAGYFGHGKKHDAWIDELLETLMLADKAEANMRTLSGGMKRRVMIAQALVHKPKVLVLDEPTAGVDVDLRQSLWTFVQRLHKEGHTILLTTHYLEEAEALCQRIGIINHGQLIALDSKSNLMKQGIGRLCYMTITLARPLVRPPEALSNKIRRLDENQLELVLNKETDSVIEVLDILRQHNADITDVNTSEPDLEQVFLTLTKRGKS